jgi:signal transduction histidine kinase
VAARERLLIERANRAELIAELLLLERTRTDEALAVERAGADAELTAREDVLGMVSHDLRTLLQGVAMSAWAIIDKAGDEPFVRGEAKRTQRFVMRMEHLISDLLDLASIEAGKLRVSASDHDAGSVVRETAEIFAPLAAAEALALVVDLREESVPAWLDRERILQVLANLVSNAIKFTEAGGTITVGARAVDSGVELFVRDTGRGIPADRLARIFERYVQASVDRRGLGLGLYISRSIVEAHGGSARVESEVGVGSTFSFVLPSRTPTR